MASHVSIGLVYHGAGPSGLDDQGAEFSVITQPGS
jgi:hypothetical protein